MTYIDIDECAAVPPLCEQICTNTEGSFECSCNDGYELGDDQQACIGESIINIEIRIYTNFVFLL